MLTDREREIVRDVFAAVLAAALVLWTGYCGIKAQKGDIITLRPIEVVQWLTILMIVGMGTAFVRLTSNPRHAGRKDQP